MTNPINPYPDTGYSNEAMNRPADPSISVTPVIPAREADALSVVGGSLLTAASGAMAGYGLYRLATTDTSASAQSIASHSLFNAGMAGIGGGLLLQGIRGIRGRPEGDTLDGTLAHVGWDISLGSAAVAGAGIMVAPTDNAPATATHMVVGGSIVVAATTLLVLMHLPSDEGKNHEEQSDPDAPKNTPELLDIRNLSVGPTGVGYAIRF